MKQVAFEVYDTFTTRPLSGNPAGVILLKQALSPSTMQQIAMEIGAPTTGFVVFGEEVGIRFFTPQREIEACGHVTLAIAAVLVERGLWQTPSSEQEHVVQTPAGKAEIRLLASHTGLRVSLALRPTLVATPLISQRDIDASIGGPPTDRLLPMEIVATGLRHLIVPYRDHESLSQLRPSQSGIVDLARRIGFDTLCAFATLDDGSAIRMRDFCGPIGAAEEAASGTTSAALGHYLERHGRWIDRWPVVVEQGVEMGRPSTILVSAHRTSDGMQVWVTGAAVKSISGSLNVD